jgi:hypothetical protein
MSQVDKVFIQNINKIDIIIHLDITYYVFLNILHPIKFNLFLIIHHQLFHLFNIY